MWGKDKLNKGAEKNDHNMIMLWPKHEEDKIGLEIIQLEGVTPFTSPCGPAPSYYFNLF